jgi:hypothetical protein
MPSLPTRSNNASSNAEGEIRDLGCLAGLRKMVLNQTPSETGVDSANNAIHLSRHPIRLGFSMTICGQVMASGRPQKR